PVYGLSRGNSRRYWNFPADQPHVEAPRIVTFDLTRDGTRKGDLSSRGDLGMPHSDAARALGCSSAATALCVRDAWNACQKAKCNLGMAHVASATSAYGPLGSFLSSENSRSKA